MLEVYQQDDGRFAVRDIGGPELNDVLAVFDSQEEADEWLLQQNLLREEGEDGPHTMRPGGNQIF
jgi:hypothetical protein